MLNSNNNCFAYSFNEIQEKIHKKNICHIDYNAIKTAAIVNIDCGSAAYINFKTRKIQVIEKDWPNVGETWKSENIAYLRGSCGTGCSQSIIFIAPSTSISCPVHEFRIESLNPDEAPDFYNNNPLLIDPHKKIYVCYAEGDFIQVFRMPSLLQATIYPPKGYYAERASLQNHRLVITYRNMKTDRLKKMTYNKIKF